MFFFIIIVFNRDNSDYKNYVAIFSGTYGVLKEKGYIYFNKLIQTLGGNYNIIPFIMGLFMVYVLFKKYDVKEKITLIFIYSIHNLIFDIIQVRNTFCVFFILIGIIFLQNHKEIKYLIINFIATSFHTIGVVYFIFYILTKINLKIYNLLLIFTNIINLLLINKYLYLLKEIFPTKTYYIENNFNYGVFIFYLLSFIDILLILFIERKKKKNREKELYIKFILFPIFFLPFGVFHGELIQRIWRNAFLLKIIYCLKFSNKKKKIVISLLVLQQIVYLGIRLWKAPEFIISLLEQFNNIEFYF